MVSSELNMHRLADRSGKFWVINSQHEVSLGHKVGFSGDSVHVDAEGEAGSSLDFLLPWAGTINRLVVTDFWIEDIGAINQFHNLLELDLWPAAKSGPAVVARELPRLRDVAFCGSVPVDMKDAVSLEKVAVEAPPASTVREIEALPTLRDLRIWSTKRLPRQLAPSITALDISGTKWNDDGSTISGIGDLKILRLTDVRGLESLMPFREVGKLDELYIEDCPDLTSLDGLQDLSTTRINVVGSTRLRDF